MSYLQHIKRCNTADLKNFRPFYIRGKHVGYVRPEIVSGLMEKRFQCFYETAQGGLVLSPELDDPAECTLVLAEIVHRVAGDKLFRPLHGEPFSVRESCDGPVLATVDRNTAFDLGLQTYSVAARGYVEKEDGTHMWLAMRAPKKFEGGTWDVLASGSLPQNITPRDHIAKELWDEAGFDPHTAVTQAVRGNVVSYIMHYPGVGLTREAIICYDLHLPDNFQPRNNETPPSVSDFKHFHLEEIASMLAEEKAQDNFKYNTPLVLLDALITQGIIPPDHPEYEDMCKGLYGPQAQAVMNKMRRTGSGIVL